MEFTSALAAGSVQDSVLHVSDVKFQPIAAHYIVNKNCNFNLKFHDMPNTTSPSILNAATGLLGFCLVVITSFHLTNKADTSLIDEFTSVIAMFLIFSCFFSFLAIRTKKEFLKIIRLTPLRYKRQKTTKRKHENRTKKGTNTE